MRSSHSACRRGSLSSARPPSTGKPYNETMVQVVALSRISQGTWAFDQIFAFGPVEEAVGWDSRIHASKQVRMNSGGRCVANVEQRCQGTVSYGWDARGVGAFF